MVKRLESTWRELRTLDLTLPSWTIPSAQSIGVYLETLLPFLHADLIFSHVSKHILENCLLSGPLASKTRVLVTHQLHVLPYVDEVIYMDNGRIVERGTYADLVAAGGQFSQLVAEYGVAEGSSTKEEGKDTTATAADTGSKAADTPATKLMQGDERTTGAVGSDAYVSYLRAAGGLSWMPFLMALLSLAQAANVRLTSIMISFVSSIN